MLALILDLETRADPTILDDAAFWERRRSKLEAPSNYKDPVKIAAYVDDALATEKAKCALSPLTGLIACVGLQRWEESEAQVLTVEQPHRQGEQDLLQALIANWPDDPRLIVGWNARQFDLPFLIARLAIHKLTLPWLPVPKNYRQVVELRDMFTNGDLSSWQFAMGGGFKDVDGEDLLELPIDELAAHCKADIEWTTELAHRTQFVWAPSMRGQD